MSVESFSLFTNLCLFYEHARAGRCGSSRAGFDAHCSSRPQAYARHLRACGSEAVAAVVAEVAVGLAVVGGPEDETGKAMIKDFCPPCGVCRQVMAEFCKKDFEIILAKSPEEYKVFTLGELLPESFSL